jgi:hypothetical protein
MAIGISFYLREMTNHEDVSLGARQTAICSIVPVSFLHRQIKETIG